MKGNFIDRHLLRGCDLEWPTLFQQSSIGDLANKFCFLFLIERWAATSADSIWNLKNRIIQIIGGRTHLGAPHQHFPIFIGRRKETAVWWKSHWPDPTWMSGEFAWIRRYSVHLHVPNIHFAIRTAAAPKWNELTNKSKKREMDEPEDEPTRCSRLDSPMPIQTKDGRSASECGYWLGLIHRPNLSNAKEEKCCSSWWTSFQWASPWRIRRRSS